MPSAALTPNIAAPGSNTKSEGYPLAGCHDRVPHPSTRPHRPLPGICIDRQALSATRCSISDRAEVYRRQFVGICPMT